MDILETKLMFNGVLKQRGTTSRIIIHHSATNGDVAASTVHQWHLDKGWSGIGYHYLIRTSGVIERGRPENTIGAHAGSAGNSDSIGICLAGNFTQNVPNPKQIDALIALINDIMGRCGKLQIIGHKDVMATACPGEKFPLSQVIQRVTEPGNSSEPSWKLDIVKEARRAGLITSDHNPEDPAEKWFVLQVALNLLKTLKA